VTCAEVGRRGLGWRRRQQILRLSLFTSGHSVTGSVIQHPPTCHHRPTSAYAIIRMAEMAAEVIFERFVDCVDHSSVRIEDEFSENFETFPMELEQGEGERRMSLQPGRNRREDSLQPSLNEESLFIEEASPSPASGIPGMSIPRRHTMDTAFSLPCHLSSHLQRRLTIVSPSRSPQASSVPREKHLLALPSSSLSSMWSLRSRASSPSPSLKGLPKKLRHSFSRLFSGSKTKSPTPPHSISASPSQASIVSQHTEEIVRESLKKGLPIIPFASPSYQIEDTTGPEPVRESPKNCDKSRLQASADETGYCLMEKNHKTSVTSQSSYVEMNPCDDPFNEEPYVRMENVFPVRAGDPGFFDFDPFSSETKKVKLRNFGEKQLKAEKGLAIEREFKKGNRHRDDYAFLDFSRNDKSTEITNAKVQHFLSL